MIELLALLSGVAIGYLISWICYRIRVMRIVKRVERDNFLRRSFQNLFLNIRMSGGMHGDNYQNHNRD